MNKSINKTIKFILLVLGIALFVYGVSLIPEHDSSIEPLQIKKQTKNSYLIIILGVITTLISLIEDIRIKS